jgi:small-conductance mechanosensitive channel
MRKRRQIALQLTPARARSLTLQTAQKARQAKRELLFLVPLLALTLFAYLRRKQLFGVDTPVRVAAAVVLLALGWALARAIGRSAAPALYRRTDPATAGTVGFLTRLGFMVIATLLALRVAGLTPQTLAVGGAITAVVVGLAAQQTLGNLIAGMVLIAARPFRPGERVRLQAGGLAGQVEGVVGSLGLLYTTFTQGEDSIMVPNNVVLSAAVVPLREPAAVDLRARLRPDVKPSQVQTLLEEAISTPVRGEPHIALEEIDRDEVVVRVAATPLVDADGPRLADEVMDALAALTRDGWTGEGAASSPGEQDWRRRSGDPDRSDDWTGRRGDPDRSDGTTGRGDDAESREGTRLTGERTGTTDDRELTGERTGRPDDRELTGRRTGRRDERELTGERTGRPRDPVTQEYES